jgi:hypothetical protein
MVAIGSESLVIELVLFLSCKLLKKRWTLFWNEIMEGHGEDRVQIHRGHEPHWPPESPPEAGIAGVA